MQQVKVVKRFSSTVPSRLKSLPLISTEYSLPSDGTLKTTSRGTITVPVAVKVRFSESINVTVIGNAASYEMRTRLFSVVDTAKFWHYGLNEIFRRNKRKRRRRRNRSVKSQAYIFFRNVCKSAYTSVGYFLYAYAHALAQPAQRAAGNFSCADITCHKIKASRNFLLRKAVFCYIEASICSIFFSAASFPVLFVADTGIILSAPIPSAVAIL